MFANTLTLTINAVAKVLTRINQDSYGSEYDLSSDLESINMKIRHSKDNTADGIVKRHNVYVEWTVYATPTTAKKYWSTTYTLRELTASGPTTLDQMSVGMLALLATLDSGLVLGEN